MPHLLEQLSKRQEVTSVGEDAEKGNPCALLMGMKIGLVTMEVPQKIKNRTTM